MTNRTCSTPGCDKPHRARGVCATHYNQVHQPNRHKQITVICQVCGIEHHTMRADGRFCSLLCRDIWRCGGEARVTKLPINHPVIRLMNGLSAARSRPIRQPTPEARAEECEWCGTTYTTRKPTQRMCSRRCKVKARQVRRRGQQMGWQSHYTWAEVVRVYARLGRVCAYCTCAIDGQPDPDHVVPLSRGGSNSITNILPCCRPCNSDKRDLPLDEWNADRARRGLPPRTTYDARWTHLTSISDAA